MPDWCANSRSSWVKLGTIKRKASGIVGPGKPNDEGEIPIGVKRARERLNLPSDGSGVSEVAGPSTDVPVVVREGRITSTLAGPPVQRLRRDAPPVVPGVGSRCGRPTLANALQLAGDEGAMQLALEQFEDLRYAAGTLATKDAMFRTWKEVCEARHFSCLPVTSAKLVEVAAVLRAASYRSGFSYLLEAKQRHGRAGFPWCEELEYTLRDCKRALTRGIGPPKRSQEVRLEWLDKMWLAEGRSFTMPTDGRWPFGGALVWALGIHFVLRELELGTLTLHEDCVSVNAARREVTLHLSTSKSDPEGRGCQRTLECLSKFGELHGLECPFCVAQNLIEVQVFRTGVRQQLEAAKHLPLIGQAGSPGSFVDKTSMIEAARADAARVKLLVAEASEVNIDGITGHFMRRAGCKRYARKGLPLELIKHMSRHSSNAVEGYVEEAMEECPQAKSRLTEFLHVQHCLESFSSKLRWLETKFEDLNVAHSQLKLKQDVAATCDDRIDKLWEHFQPEFVLNTTTRKKHSTVGCNFRNPPALWVTACGWRWAFAGSGARPLSRTELDDESFVLCDRCKVCIG